MHWSTLTIAGTLTRQLALHDRFRSDEGLQDKPIWEKTGKPGEGIVALEADTEPVQNINQHRQVVRNLHCAAPWSAQIVCVTYTAVFLKQIPL